MSSRESLKADLRDSLADTLIRLGRVGEERDFLLARAADAGSIRFDDSKRWVGISSNALVRYVFGGAEPTEGEYPRDPSDLAACYRTLHRLPEHLKDGAIRWVARYRETVLQRYPLEEMDNMLANEGALSV